MWAKISSIHSSPTSLEETPHICAGCEWRRVLTTNANDPLGGRGKWYKFEGAFILMFSILILDNLERNLNAAVLEPFPVILEVSWQMQEHFWYWQIHPAWFFLEWYMWFCKIYECMTAYAAWNLDPQPSHVSEEHSNIASRQQTQLTSNQLHKAIHIIYIYII